MATLLSPQPPQIKSSLLKYPLRRISVHSPPFLKFSFSARPIFQLQTQPKYRSGKLTFHCSAALTTIDQSDFESVVLKSDVPVLVEFVASWCGPCRLISPVIDWASQEYEGKLKIVKIDHDANPQLIEQYKVYGLPCLILFKNGKQIPESRREGAITKAKLKQYIDTLLSSKTVI